MHSVFMKNRLRLLLVALAMIVMPQLSSAQSSGGKLDLSIGWGDQMFESLVWRNESAFFGFLPETETVRLKGNYHYSQHWFLSADYNVTKWFSVGAMADFSSVSWEELEYNGSGDLLCSDGLDHFSNISLMPVASFTYLRRPHFSMHSGLGAGLNINTGSRLDYLSRATACAPVMYLNVVGVRGTMGRYFASVDLGGLASLNHLYEVYLFGSRLVSVSVGITL